uniref:SAM-dependent methyltransferase TRM5/TYW2-type domain-containing protein n=1 Tax=Noctiluca scintillans TaxID=2966 RepID=A0A7S1EZB4_NOCSC
MEERHVNRPTFEQRKRTFLGKSDKSSAGGIDAHCVQICEDINNLDAWFTTSSCSGRAFMWRGEGVKSTDQFLRFGVTHELIPDPPALYFDLALESSPEGGEDAQRRIIRSPAPSKSGGCFSAIGHFLRPRRARRAPALTWLRFEPFILHVCCCDQPAASALMAAARTVFKNVGLQSIGADDKLIVAIFGDEGLDMPLTTPDGVMLFSAHAEWLQDQLNSRHQRNWAKIERFRDAVRGMTASRLECLAGAGDRGERDEDNDVGSQHYDVVGDVIVLQNAPPESEYAAVGARLLREVKRARLVAVRCSALDAEHRAPTLKIIAGPQRSPLITTHSEFGCRYVIDLNSVFFSTKMAAERQRMCQLVQPGERICVLFAGCGPEVVQFSKTSAAEVRAVEINSVAVRCLERSVELLRKSAPEAAQKIFIHEGDVREVVPVLEGKFDRVVAPRPRGHTDDADEGAGFLALLLPLLRDGGVVHWFDFVADWELPECVRTRARVQGSCEEGRRHCEIHRCAVANRQTVAQRQYRAVVDFQV